jgi:hypothetical protein
MIVDGGLNPRKSGAGLKLGTGLAVEPLVARLRAGRFLLMPKPPLGGGRRPAFTGAYQPATIGPAVGGWMHFQQPSCSVIAVYARILAAGNNDLSPDEIERRIALWNEVNREDREKLERTQHALGSRFAPSGPLAPTEFEGTIWDFYRYLARCAATAGETVTAER